MPKYGTLLPWGSTYLPGKRTKCCQCSYTFGWHLRTTRAKLRNLYPNNIIAP
jgi:hypothetical protein